MYQYQDQKEMRRALNGKMIIMLVGIMLVVTALTSSLSYGMRCWSMAGMADGGDKDILEALKQIGITSGTLRICSVIYYLQAVIEVFVGVFCARLSNRLDKNALLWKMAWVILVVEVAAGVALTLLHMTSAIMIVSNLLLPGFLLWAVNSLRKVAKNHPDRIYAVEPNNRNKGKEKEKGKAKASVQPAKAGQKKSLMEHATQVTPADITPLELTRELEKAGESAEADPETAAEDTVAEENEQEEETSEKTEE
ncbi:hypothetical protein [Blautia sp.]